MTTVKMNLSKCVVRTMVQHRVIVLRSNCTQARYCDSSEIKFHRSLNILIACKLSECLIMYVLK